ncbi:MAG: glycoside hydrolase family 30 protein [Schleiferiaceae bacterium]|nr:glycoside hydrolase family 30 protein [Schleiferiaceae bacterium]
MRYLPSFLLLLLLSSACQEKAPPRADTAGRFTVWQTSAQGHKLDTVTPVDSAATDTFLLQPEQTFQTITGFGGAFTEASAHVLGQLSARQRQRVLRAYFADTGAAYSLTRTHINSCDFSLGHYSYDTVPGDTALRHFSIAEDTADLIPMIQAAQDLSSDGFRIIASPWTAPPWMKTNEDWEGGRLKPAYYHTWAQYLHRYLQAYDSLGVPIWALTVENEPLGNNESWESMHYSPATMGQFITRHLQPVLAASKYDPEILFFDQNRDEEMLKWARHFYNNDSLRQAVDGIAIHWYASTFKWFPERLQAVHKRAPTKRMIQTEACVDAEVPHWRDDAWYWRPEATDWGYQWARPENKDLHPPYVPAYRYARDIIGCLNNQVQGWVDWNLVLNRQGGPNHAQNWCIAPVIADPRQDAVYFTPLYYIMAHFSKFIRPGAKRIALQTSNQSTLSTAVRNPDGSLVAVLFNSSSKGVNYRVKTPQAEGNFHLAPRALQTLLLQPEKS